jgi:RimJ/RimL family protein N-acetyltransferase
MLSTLESALYSRAASLFKEMNHHLAVVTVLRGQAPGTIYADNPITPLTAILLPTNQHRIYIAGSSANKEVNEAIQALFTRKLAVKARGTGVSQCVVYYSSDGWKSVLEQILKGWEISIPWRQYYQLKELCLNWRNALPENITIHPIDEALLADLTLENREKVIEEIHSESPSIEHFLRHNFGFCAQHDHTLVGWCLAEYHSQNRYELGIETIEPYQRKGIATLTASAVIEHALAKGTATIGWHCWANNIASVAAAKKLGFEKVIDYPVCYCIYQQEHAKG